MQRLAIDFFQTRVLISLANPRYQILLARLMIYILVVHLRDFIIMIIIINTKLGSMITVITEKKILMKILMFIAINEHENEMVGVMVIVVVMVVVVDVWGYHGFSQCMHSSSPQPSIITSIIVLVTIFVLHIDKLQLIH